MLSIIVPCYNVEHYLLKCVDSILKQAYKEIEIVLIDDGSTDGTKKVMEEQCQDSRIRKIYLDTNRPVGEVRNIGLQQAKGAYITFVDADDYVHPDIYRHTLPFLDRPGVDAVFFDHYVAYPKSQKVSEMIVNGTTGIYENEQKILLFRKASYCWNVIFKAELLNIGWKTYDLALYEDLACHMLLVLSDKVAYVKRPLYYHIKHPNSVTETARPGNHALIVDAVDILIRDVLKADCEDLYYDVLVNIVKIYLFYYVYYLISVEKCPADQTIFFKIKKQFMDCFSVKIKLFSDPLIWLHLYHTHFWLFLLKFPFLRKWIGGISRRHMH